MFVRPSPNTNTHVHTLYAFHPTGFFVCKLKVLKNGPKEEAKGSDEENEDGEEMGGEEEAEEGGKKVEKAEPTVRVSVYSALYTLHYTLLDQ